MKEMYFIYELDLESRAIELLKKYWSDFQFKKNLCEDSESGENSNIGIEWVISKLLWSPKEDAK